jgi:hypothetical protein
MKPPPIRERCPKCRERRVLFPAGAVTLRRSGVVLDREYACGNRRTGSFRARPNWRLTDLENEF